MQTSLRLFQLLTNRMHMCIFIYESYGIQTKTIVPLIISLNISYENNTKKK